MDLAEGHMLAVSYLEKSLDSFQILNLGTGKSTSVLELIFVYEKVSGQEIKKVVVEKRLGDLPIYYASAYKAKQILNWSAHRTLENVCESDWLWIGSK